MEYDLTLEELNRKKEEKEPVSHLEKISNIISSKRAISSADS